MLRRRRYAQEANVDTAVDGRDYGRRCFVSPDHGCRLLRRPRPLPLSKFTNKAYIVRLAEKPVVAYDGGIKGLQATRPRKGEKIDPNSPAVVNYRSFLESRQDAVLASVGGGKKLYSYGYVFNGFAAELTAAQAAEARGDAGVLAVDQGRGARTRHVLDAGFPRPQRRRAASGTSTGATRRERHHRHRRRRRLAGEPELLRPHRHERQRNQGRQAVLPADSGLERQVRPRRAVQRVATATRS